MFLIFSVCFRSAEHFSAELFNFLMPIAGNRGEAVKNIVSTHVIRFLIVVMAAMMFILTAAVFAQESRQVMPAAFKKTRFVTLIGQPGGGGFCIAATASGSLFRISGSRKPDSVFEPFIESA